jgi:hypothetical protein
VLGVLCKIGMGSGSESGSGSGSGMGLIWELVIIESDVGWSWVFWCLLGQSCVVVTEVRSQCHLPDLCWILVPGFGPDMELDCGVIELVILMALGVIPLDPVKSLLFVFRSVHLV